jgi:hypothetical protein
MGLFLSLPFWLSFRPFGYARGRNNKREKQKQIPFGNDNKKSKSKSSAEQTAIHEVIHEGASHAIDRRTTRYTQRAEASLTAFRSCAPYSCSAWLGAYLQELVERSGLSHAAEQSGQ